MIPYERIKQHLAGDTVPLIEREDYFWAAIGGADVEAPTPLNPWEECLAAIAALPQGKKEITSTAEVNVGAYATAQVVDENLVAANIKKDVAILGVTGTYEPTDANLKPENIKKDVTIFGVTGTYEGAEAEE